MMLLIAAIAAGFARDLEHHYPNLAMEECCIGACCFALALRLIAFWGFDL
jgi:hypothetical protein